MSDFKPKEITYFEGYGELTDQQVYDFVQRSLEDNLLFQNIHYIRMDMRAKFLKDENASPEVKNMITLLEEHLDNIENMMNRRDRKRIGYLRQKAQKQYHQFNHTCKVTTYGPCSPGYEDFYVLNGLDLKPQRLADYPTFINTKLIENLKSLGLLFETESDAEKTRSAILDLLKP